MEGLLDTFGDLASFSLANEFISNNDVPVIASETLSRPLIINSDMSLFQSEYINYIYIGIGILVIIVGGLIYKFNYVKRKVDNNIDTNDYSSQSQCFGGICPR